MTQARLSNGIINDASNNEYRDELHHRFEDRIHTNKALTRTLVSYQGNKKEPGFRWFKYKEGFSLSLIENLIAEHKPHTVLDPFAGIGTVPLAGSWYGASALGIEIMPIGTRVAQAIWNVAHMVSEKKFHDASSGLLKRLKSPSKPKEDHYFRHVPITDGAFSSETEVTIAKAREFISNLENPYVRHLLDFACMAVLEECSFTRKDGQFLRWDRRSGRPLRSNVDLGPIPSFADALAQKFQTMAEDFPVLKRRGAHGKQSLRTGSCLEHLRLLPANEIDLVITSPPYANRYDYTRTYALELAWLGFDRAEFSKLRQSMLTATVENGSKVEKLQKIYSADKSTLQLATRMFEKQRAVWEILRVLSERAEELSNKNVIRLLKGYFFEMAIVIAELSRLVRPGGSVIMINDNVQYHGEQVPVDLILSDFAEQCGFRCDQIAKLSRGKGNSSQQMAKFGRREIRKCMYTWTRLGD